MKKIMSIALLLTLSVAASAQTTAERIIALMPALPSDSAMIRYQKETTAPSSMQMEVTEPDLYIDFFEALKEAQEKAQELMEQEGGSMLGKAMGSQVGETGLTVSQVQGMSESQLEQMARGQVANKLSSLGLSMSDLAKLGDGDVSDEQAMALAAKMAANRKTAPTAGGNTSKYMQQLAAFGPRELALQEKIRLQPDQAMKAGRELYNRDFRARVEACEATMKEAMKEGAFSEKYAKEQEPAVKAAEKKFYAAEKKKWETECEFYAKFIPMWRNALLTAMNLCKKDYLTLMNEKKQVTDTLHSLTQSAEYALGAVYPAQAASLYLEQPDEIDQYANVLEE